MKKTFSFTYLQQIFTKPICSRHFLGCETIAVKKQTKIPPLMNIVFLDFPSFPWDRVPSFCIRWFFGSQYVLEYHFLSQLIMWELEEKPSSELPLRENMLPLPSYFVWLFPLDTRQSLQLTPS